MNKRVDMRDLAEPGLTVGRQANNLGKFQKFEVCCKIKIFDFCLYLAKVQHCFSKFNAFLKLIQVNKSARLFY